MTKILILLLFCIVEANWISTWSILEHKAGFYIRDLYIEPEDGTYFILYGARVDRQTRLYMMLGSNPLPEGLWREDEGTVWLGGKFAKVNGTDHFFVLLNRLRKSKPKEPSPYFDIYIAEKRSGNSNWEELTAITRKDLNDSCQRFGSVLLYIPSNNRIYTVYHKECTLKNSSIMISNRSVNEKTFSEEQNILSTDLGPHVQPTVQLTYSLNGSAVILHVFFVLDSFPNKQIMHTKSYDNGKNWTKPRKVFEDISFSGMRSLQTITTNRLASSMIIGGFTTQSPSPIQIFVSRDHGETFERKLGSKHTHSVFSWDYDSFSLALCENSDDPKLFIFSSVDHYSYEYSVLDLNEDSPNRTENQFSFKGQCLGSKIFCANMISALEITVVFPVRVGSSYQMTASIDVLYKR